MRWLPLGAVLISACCLFPTLFNGFVNWDDEAYVTENRMVNEFSGAHVKDMFTTPEQVGLYHPFTLLSLSIDHQLWQGNPFGFHLTNLLLHLLNVCLVYFLILRLTEKPWAAFLAALLFGMHPMHLESVAWISARKDVLYVFFYVFSLLAYLRFRDNERPKPWLWWTLALVCFLFSLLAKAMAFSLPVVLLLLDYLQQRKWEWKIITEKLPFFLLTIAALIVAKSGQQASDSMLEVAQYPLYKTVFIGTWNVWVYLFKAVIPVGLSPFHPFPFMGSIEIPWYYYLSIVPIFATLYLGIRNFKTQRAWIFGIAFFLVCIGPMLQILPYGKAIIAERYTYLAYVGLFFLTGLGLDNLLTSLPHSLAKFKTLFLVLISGWVVALGIVTFNNAKVWKNGNTLWTSIIEAYPDHYLAYLNRSKWFSMQPDAQWERADLDQAIALNPNLWESYYELGRWEEQAGNLPAAIAQYDLAIDRNAQAPKAFLNRGILRARVNQDLDGALSDFDQTIALDTTYALAFLNRGLVYKINGNLDASQEDYDRAIALEPWNPVFYRNRAILQFARNDLEATITDLSTALDLKPDYAEVWFYRAEAYRALGSLEAAKQDALEAQTLGFSLPDGFMNSLSPPLDSLTQPQTP